LYGLVLISADPDQAIAEFKAELAISPRQIGALFSLAQEYDKRADYKSALPFANQALYVDPGFAPAHALLGKILVDGGSDANKGIGEIETAIKMSPSNPQNHYLLAMAYSKVGRSADAARERAAFIKLRNDSPIALQKPVEGQK
jgi:tetratricopeptide (TPR) repeat protein